eukprot:GHVS01006523.1.p1 GENE.GHVS01006523.1~~GHVS01006523.1.p1  ORF type:complete len:177 (-),score=31.36 GHVS01006523.1:5-535(-)
MLAQTKLIVEPSSCLTTRNIRHCPGDNGGGLVEGQHETTGPEPSVGKVETKEEGRRVRLLRPAEAQRWRRGRKTSDNDMGSIGRETSQQLDPAQDDNSLTVSLHETVLSVNPFHLQDPSLYVQHEQRPSKPHSASQHQSPNRHTALQLSPRIGSNGMPGRRNTARCVPLAMTEQWL